MLKQEEIERLAELDASPSRVLSVYLDLDPSMQVRRAYRIAFEDLVKYVRLAQSDATLPQFSDEVARVQTFLETEAPRGKGLVVLTSAPRVLWRAEFLAVRVPNHLVFEPRPDVAPLLRIMDEYERYAVALIDKTRARLFTVFMGEIEESDSLRDTDAVGRTDQGGWSQAGYQRHHEWHVYEHLKAVAGRLAELHRQRRFERLILAGPEEAATELRRILPRTLARHVVAVIRARIDAGAREILDKTLEVERWIEREDEERLLRQLMDLAGPGGRSVFGVRPTLAALWADLVQTLVVAQGARGEGSECPNCERLEPGRIERCPTCDSAMRHVHDVFHRATQRVVERAGRAEIVYGDAERRLQELGAGMAALLRSPSPVPQLVASGIADQERQTSVHKEWMMANEQSKRQGERQAERQQSSASPSTATQSTAMERGGGERGLATRQYQDPFSLFDTLFERMQRDFFGTSLLNALIPARGGDGDGQQFVRMPRVQMRDTGDALELRAEMPGIEAGNVSVRLEDDVLTISGEQREEEEGDGARTERYVSFYRQIPLPDDIDTERAEASYRDGVLTVRFPKTRERSSARQIPVTASQEAGQSGQQQAKERAA